MLRRFLGTIAVVALLIPLLAACAQKSDPDAVSDIRLYQVLPAPREKSKLAHAPGDGEVIAFVNAGKKVHTIEQWQVQTNSGAAMLPKISLQPGQTVYLADNALYFEAYWNFPPDYEYGGDTDKAVPDLKAVDDKPPVLNDKGDIVRLLDEKGTVVDILAYGSIGSAPSPWSGPAVQLINSFPITPANQVITRNKRDGVISSGTTAEAWSGGTPQEPGRVWFAGQSDFPVKSVTGPMTLIAASAPDNAGLVLYDLIDKAKKTIRMVSYQYTNVELGQHLIDAVKRGVKVQMVVERNPGGSDIYESDKQAQELLAKGGVEVLYYYKWDGDLSTRYNPVHNKYAIFDDESVLVASGNFTYSVYNLDPSCGNREWMVVIKNNPDVVKMIREVWDADYASGQKEVRHWDEKLDRMQKPDDYDAGPCFKYTPVKPEPLTLTGVNATVTRILSPDNTMDREKGFLSLLRNAKQELLISANYINLWWGSSSDPSNLTKNPDPYITEIVAAARRGVDVKVIFDRKSVQAGNQRDNQYVVQYLNDLGAREHLKLQAHLINMDGSGIGRTYHNKSLIVDGAAVISSINGSENSFRYARELALRIEGVPQFTAYYRDLFMHDWQASEKPNEPWNVMATPRTSGTFIDWSKNAELDVVGYEVYYKPSESAGWVKVGQMTVPGLEDSHASGIWGVVAINKAGLKSNYAVASR